MIFKSYKKKVKGHSYCLFLLLLLSITNIFAQQTNNLQVIWHKTSPDSVIAYGRCIASGDVNGDGFSDIIFIGDSIAGPYPNRGKCWIFYGSSTIDTVPDVQLLNNEQQIFYGLHSCDINSDGFDDIVLGAQYNAQPFGEVLIFLGGNPMDSICDYRIRGPQSGSGFGGIGIGSGDVNGDGYKDLIVGACGASEMAGRVYIYFGGPNFDTIPDIILNGGHDNEPECFGYTVSGSGDVNNDGFDDVIIGAYAYGAGYQGRIYIYYGGNPMDTNYDVAMTGEGGMHLLGVYGVVFVRNQQTNDNAITGVSMFEGERGKVYVLFGGNPMDSIPDVCIVGRTPTSRLGQSVASAGFVSDLFSEGIIAGAPIEDSSTGAMYYWRSGSLLDTIPDAWIKGVIGNSGIGCHVATAGNVDGDSRDEMITSNSWAGLPMRVWVCKYTGIGIEEKHQLLSAVRFPLEVNPNPVKTNLAIRYPLTADRINLKIYDIMGKIVKTIKVDSRQNTEYREVRWDLRDENKRRVANGVYFVEVTVDEVNSRQNTENRKTMREIRKIVVAK